MKSPLITALILASTSYPPPPELKELSRSASGQLAKKLEPGADRPLPQSLSAVRGRANVDAGLLATFDKRIAALSSAKEPTLRGAKESQVYRESARAVTLIVTKTSLGSGVLLDGDGKILTNAHVVGDSREVGVIFKPEQEGAEIGDADVRIAKVLKVDQVADLALIQVATVPAGIRPLALGKVEGIPVGADVHAIGHPDGESWTYTRGIVSQVRRNYQWVTESGLKHEATVVQTQTPINPGNSGGPLLNDAGEVVGINAFGNQGEGLNFAVSADDVRQFLQRPGDRKAEAAERPEQTAKKDCEVEILGTKKSEKHNAVEDLLDFDCDGKADAIAVTPDDPKEGVMVLIDSDANGAVDRYLLDADRNDHFEVEYYDRDEDGEPDLVGYIREGEDEPHMWERIPAQAEASPKKGRPRG